jgi:hypothetical protein
LDKIGETFVPRRRPVLARMARQQPRRPQLVRIFDRRAGPRRAAAFDGALR